MKLTFSQRQGLEPVNSAIQINSMNLQLRNGLWSTLCVDFFNHITNSQYVSYEQKTFLTHLWKNHYELPVDAINNAYTNAMKKMRGDYFESEWNKAFELVEFIAEYCSTNYPQFQIYKSLNSTLENALSAYRFINGELTDITDSKEIAALEEALNDSTFSGVAAHLAAALNLYSDRDNPDYRNSIKESISAVESMARVVTGLPKATLGQALKVLKKDGTIHTALLNGFDNLYGYTSDEEGIRHSMLGEPNLTAADAKYFLLSCTSFVNYLKSKI